SAFRWCRNACRLMTARSKSSIRMNSPALTSASRFRSSVSHSRCRRSPPVRDGLVLSMRIAALALLASAAGCESMREWIARRDVEPVPATVAADEEPGPYVREMYEIANGDPARQAEIFADAAAAAELTPDTMSRLRFALVLAMPGHPGSDPQRAQAMLRELLARPELLTPLEKSLATIHL